MTTQEGFAAAADLIHGIAAKWDAVGPAIGAISRQTDGMNFHGYDPGLFKPVIDAHAGVIQKVAGRCTEAAEVFGRISHTLNQIADTYATLDARSAGRIKALTIPAPTVKLIR